MSDKQSKPKLNNFNKIAIAAGIVLAISNGVLYKQISDIKESVTNNSSENTTDSVIDLDKRVLALESNVIDDTAFQDYIMENPADIIKSLAKYRFEQDQVAKSQKDERALSQYDALFNDPNDPFYGNPNGTHVIVEFIDYNCGHCKNLAPKIEDFIAADPQAKVIVKQFPIFRQAPTSAYAAMMGLALNYYKPELFHNYHEAVISQRRLTRESIDKVITDLGVSKDDLQPHLEKAKQHIEDVRSLAGSLNVTGTPTVFPSSGGQPFHGVSSAGQIISRFK